MNNVWANQSEGRVNDSVPDDIKLLAFIKYFTDHQDMMDLQNGYESNDSVELETDITRLLGKGDISNDQEQMNGIWRKDENTHYLAEDDAQPFIKILEQPQARGFRFRYECEGPSHGGLQGERSEKYRKTFPSIKIENYIGPAKIIVSLVSDTDEDQPHAHKLVGKNCKNGNCVVEWNGKTNPEIQFPTLCIQHVTRKKASEVLTQRLLDDIQISKMIKSGDLNATPEIAESERLNAKARATKLAKDMHLNVVRLCFRAYLCDENGQYNRMLPRVVSDPIYDSKSPGANALKICRMDKYGGCCTGGEEVFLLCERVQKDDIDVRFVEQDDDGNTLWESYGNFGPFDVHRQYAIVFKTPQYRNTNIDKAVNVLIMLQRKSDKEVSDPKSFTYYPQNIDREHIAKKRRKVLPSIGGGSYGPPGGPGEMGQGLGNGGTNGTYFPTDGGQTNGGLFSTNSTGFFNGVNNGFPERSQDVFNIPPFVPQDDMFELFPRGGQVLDFPLTNDLYQFELADGLDYVDSAGPQAATLQQKPCPVTTSGLQEQKPCPVTTSGLQEQTPCPVGTSAVQEQKCDISLPAETEPLKPVTSLPPQTVLPPQAKLLYFLFSVQTEKDNVIRTVERTTRALRLYAVTSDERHLLIAQRYLTNVTDENGDLPLHLAIINNQLQAVKNLLDVMVTLPSCVDKVNAYNDLLQTPLHLAVLTNQPAVIDLLLCAGASPRLLDRRGNTPAHLAVETSANDCLKILLKYLRPGATQAKPFPELNVFNFDGLAPVHLAAQTENFHAMKLLVYGKADVNLQDGKSGKTPLHFAVEADNLSVAGYLILEAGCDIDARCFDGNTALHMASGRGNVGMAALLMAAGADPDIENEDVGENSDVEEDSEVAQGSDDESSQCIGLTAEDYAQGNEKMIRVLRGEPYSSMSELKKEAEEEEFRMTTDMFSSLRLTSGLQTESGLGSIGMFIPGGDMALITFPTRIQLSHLLDPVCTGQDWLALAEKLGMKKLLVGVESDPSPTRVLLNYFEEYGGTIARLTQALRDIHRMDAVNLISKLHLSGPPDVPPPRSTHKKYTGTSTTADKCALDAGRVDSGLESGLESMNLRSQKLDLKSQHNT
ncbi:hypothetical protein ScPMuIL_004607 [Solemya velum]